MLGEGPELFFASNTVQQHFRTLKLKQKHLKNILFCNRTMIYCSRGKLTTQLHAQPRLYASDRRNYCTGEPREQPAPCWAPQFHAALASSLLLRFWIGINHLRRRVEHCKFPEAASYRQSFSIRGSHSYLVHLHRWPQQHPNCWSCIAVKAACMCRIKKWGCTFTHSCLFLVSCSFFPSFSPFQCHLWHLIFPLLPWQCEWIG